jgi:hypothetical protein
VVWAPQEEDSARSFNHFGVRLRVVTPRCSVFELAKGQPPTKPKQQQSMAEASDRHCASSRTA